MKVAERRPLLDRSPPRPSQPSYFQPSPLPSFVPPLYSGLHPAYQQLPPGHEIGTFVNPHGARWPSFWHGTGAAARTFLLCTRTTSILLCSGTWWRWDGWPQLWVLYWKPSWQVLRLSFLGQPAGQATSSIPELGFGGRIAMPYTPGFLPGLSFPPGQERSIILPTFPVGTQTSADMPLGGQGGGCLPAAPSGQLASMGEMGSYSAHLPR